MECLALNTCTCVSGWTRGDCLTGMVTYIHLNSLYSLITTQQFIVYHVVLTNNVQLLILVYVLVDGQEMSLKRMNMFN